MAELKYVALGPEGERVPNKPDASKIFWERHPDHPHNEEALVVKGVVVQVADTPAVRLAVATGLLKYMPASAATPQPPDVADIIDQTPAPNAPTSSKGKKGE